MSSDIAKQLDALPIEKRALLFEKLQQRKQKETVAQPTITRQSRNGEGIPLSFAQQRLWFLDQYEPDSPQYNIPYAFRVNGELDLAILQQSIEMIAHRHESLRTTFTSVNGKPVQTIANRAIVDLPVIDLSHLSGNEREREVQRLIGEEAQRPFNLARGPLMRTKLLKLAAEEHVFLLTFHHIRNDVY